MPVKNLKLLGDWRKNSPKYGWTDKDIAILTSEKGVEKIKRQFSKSEHEFNLYFVRHRTGKDMLQAGHLPDGLISDQFEIPEYSSDDIINIMFTNNIAAERTPMTAWTIAHRMGHVFTEVKAFEYMFEAYQRGMNKVLSAYNLRMNFQLNLPVCGVFNEIGTMRSARLNKISRYGEFSFELVAQSILCGRIRFNQLGKRVIARRRFAWGNEAHEYSYLRNGNVEDVNDDLNLLADITHCDIDMCLSGIYGKTLVM